MAASSSVIAARREVTRKIASPVKRRGGPDLGILLGIAISASALFAGVAVTGVSARYFFQPAGILVVIGGTLGVMLMTTPPASLLFAFRRTLQLFSTGSDANPEELIEEIVGYAKAARIEGILGLEPAIDQVSESFLKEALLFAMDAKERAGLQSVLENKVRFFEKQSEAAARVLEAAGGLTPTIGVLGTVIGLIDILRQFSSLATIASGVGVAFTSTIYGLVLANLALLHLASRIRARASEAFDLQELMMEGALCIFDGMHPRLVRQRLQSFVETRPALERSATSLAPAAVSERV